MHPPDALIRAVVSQALAEDISWGDITTETVIPRDLHATARISARSAGVLCGISVMAESFRQVDALTVFAPALADGAPLTNGARIAHVSGRAASLLTAERVALNFLQRLSGIASLTACFVEATRGTRARIVDTRKTTPGLRILEKYAVRCGGGGNHRFNLADGVLIKDNHLAALGSEPDPNGVAISRSRDGAPHTMRIEVEVDSFEQLEAALRAGADIILLDNMPATMLAEAVKRVNGRALTEASGGVSLATVRAIAESGVDLISVGALTHSAPALDIGLDFEISP